MKCKRLLAVVSIVLIAALYVSTIIFSVLKSPNANNLLMASIFCTIMLPVLLFAYQLAVRVMRRHKEDE